MATPSTRSIFKAYPVRAVIDGRIYNGHFEETEGGKMVSVSSAYGSLSGPAGTNPKQAATTMLERIVRRRQGGEPPIGRA